MVATMVDDGRRKSSLVGYKYQEAASHVDRKAELTLMIFVENCTKL